MDLINGFLDYISAEKRYSEHTLKAYTTDLTQFVDFVKSSYNEDNLIKVNSVMVRSWVIELMDNEQMARSVNRKLSSLKSFYRYLLREGLISINPMTKVLSPKVKSRLPGFVDQEVMRELLSNELFEDSLSGKRDRLVIMLLYYTGMRRSELIGLRASFYDEYNRTLKVLGKGNKERIIPINTELTSLISEYRNQLKLEPADLDKTYLLLTDARKPLYPNFVYRLVRNHLSKVSTAQKRSPHILRHTFATHMLNNGADLNAIKEILGHANLSATQIYTHNSIEQLKSIYKQAHPKA
ncbi:MAG: tyrosine-type recombinase/integrase [Vicingaceae bacterium]